MLARFFRFLITPFPKEDLMFRSLMNRLAGANDTSTVVRVPFLVLVAAALLAIALTPKPLGVDCSDEANAEHIDCGGGG